MRITLTPGQRHDVTEASALLEGIECQCLIADRGYDSDAFIEELTSRDIEVVIPPRKRRIEPRDYDKEKYKSRNIIERFIGYLKRYRRVATRYDKLAVRYLGFVYFAAILIQCR